MNDHTVDEYEPSGEKSAINSPLFGSLYSDEGNNAVKSMIGLT